MATKGYLDISINDYVVVYDEYSHDYVEHIIKITSAECDDAFISECNPNGKVFYGDDISYSDTEDYISQVCESNFIRFM